MNILSVRAEVCLVGQVKTGIQNPTSACFLRSSVNFTILQGAYWPYLDTGSGMCEQDGCLCSHLPVYRTLPSPSRREARPGAGTRKEVLEVNVGLVSGC